MAYFLFIDESGHDRRESPYEVLAGVAVQDRDLWNLIQALREAEIKHFGRRYTADRGELKAKKILKAKTTGSPRSSPRSHRRSVPGWHGGASTTGPPPEDRN